MLLLERCWHQSSDSFVIASEYFSVVKIKTLGYYNFHNRYNLGGYTCGHCFQLLGVDVILDNNLHPVVIEVNHTANIQL